MSTPEKVKQEILQKLRSLSETVTDSIGDMANGKQIFCESNTVSNRMQICNACPYYIQTTSQCKKCGCFMTAKTRLKRSRCPVGKWGEEI